MESESQAEIRTVGYSVNGFRRQLHEGLSELRELLQAVINDDYYDKGELIDKFDNLACLSNSFNCVHIESVPDFELMEDVELDLLGDYESYPKCAIWRDVVGADFGDNLIVLKNVDESAPPFLVLSEDSELKPTLDDSAYLSDFGGSFHYWAKTPDMDNDKEWNLMSDKLPVESCYVLVRVEGESKPRVAWPTFYQPQNKFAQFVFSDVQDTEEEEELNEKIDAWFVLFKTK